MNGTDGHSGTLNVIDGAPAPAWRRTRPVGASLRQSRVAGLSGRSAKGGVLDAHQPGARWEEDLAHAGLPCVERVPVGLREILSVGSGHEVFEIAKQVCPADVRRSCGMSRQGVRNDLQGTSRDGRRPVGPGGLP